MSDQKVLIFGSFTEDEIKSLQRQPPQNDVEIKFGSLDSATLRSVGIFNAKLTELDYFKGRPSKLLNKKKAAKSVCTTENTSQTVATTVDENGSIHYSCPFLHNDVIKQLNRSNVEVSVSFVSDNVSDPPRHSSPKQHSIEDATISSNPLESEAFNDSSVVVDLVNSKEIFFKASDGPSATVRSLLPRGLVNLGNLCFLNATLQALLSCSPLVLLLQELRTRNMPKIGYPTLQAFVEFVSDFDMPPESSSKKKEMVVLETGRSFRPVMFESVLKIFSPDVPNSISGRPRQEDAQEFLSFVMHQMHDELLKLEGQIPSENGEKTSLVSAMNDDDDDDDNWETVGPRNKTAITRTQSFIPSKLSAIFGGRIRSVVKARDFIVLLNLKVFLKLLFQCSSSHCCSLSL